jgi:hypothetical protein
LIGHKIFRIVVIGPLSPEDESEIQLGIVSTIDEDDVEMMAVSGSVKHDVLYTFFEEAKAEKLGELFEKYGVLLSFADVTEDLMLGRSGLLDTKEYKTAFSESKQRELLDNFIRTYMTSDMVLDKILEYGKESLREIDIEILKKESEKMCANTMMNICNAAGEQFVLNICGNQLDEHNEPIPWWFKAEVKITVNGETINSELELLTPEDLILLHEWLEKIYSGEETKTIFQFVDGHVWFRKWRICNKPMLRFFIKEDEKTKYYWDWDYIQDVNQVFLSSIRALALKA